MGGNDKEFVGLGTFLYEFLLDGRALQGSEFFDHLNKARTQRKKGEDISSKKSLEKALRSMDVGSAPHHLFVAAEYLESNKFYDGMSMPKKGRRKNKWNHKIKGGYQSHLEQANILESSSLAHTLLGATTLPENYDAAMDEFSKAVEIHRSSEERNNTILSLIGHATSKVVPLKETYKVVEDVARKHSRAFSQKNPAYHALLHIGFDHLNNQEFEEGIALFKEVDKIFNQQNTEKQSDGALGVAFAFLKQEKWDEAEQSFQKIKGGDVRSVDGLSAIFEARKGLYEDALLSFKKSKEGEPGSLGSYRHNWCSPTFHHLMPTINYWHARSLKELGRDKEAISLLKKTFQRYPEASNNSELPNLLSRLYFKTGQGELARPYSEGAADRFFQEGVHHSIFQKTPSYLSTPIIQPETPKRGRVKWGYALTGAGLAVVTAYLYITDPPDIKRLCYPEYQGVKADAAQIQEISDDVNSRLDVFVQGALAGEYGKAKITFFNLGEPLKTIHELSTARAPRLVKSVEADMLEIENSGSIPNPFRHYCLFVKEGVVEEFDKALTRGVGVISRAEDYSNRFAYVWQRD